MQRKGYNEGQKAILKLLKDKGPLTELQITEFLGVRVTKTVRALVEKKCVKVEEGLSNLFGIRYKRSIVKIYSYLQDLPEVEKKNLTEVKKQKALNNAIEKACEFLHANGYKISKE